MDDLSKVLSEVWFGPVKDEFKRGFLTYERQAQAFICNCLKDNLPNSQIWIEPLLNLEDRSVMIPDIVITKGDFIEAIIELKWKPWEFPQYQYDLQKLKLLSEYSGDHNFTFGWKPISDNWNLQKNYKETHSYRLRKGFLKVMMVMAKRGSGFFSSDNFVSRLGIENAKDWKFLGGQIENGKSEDSGFYERLTTTITL